MNETAKKILDQYNKLPDNLKERALEFLGFLVERNKRSNDEPMKRHRAERTRGEIMTGIVPGADYTPLRRFTAEANGEG